MICILKMNEGEIKGWILASDIDDARRKCPDQELSAHLYRMTFTPPPGKHDLPGGLIMLVS